MKLRGIGATTALMMVLALPTFAQETTTDSSQKSGGENKPVLKSANGKLSIKLRGRALFDNAWINDSDNTVNLAASEFRAARVGIDGKYGDKISFRFTADFAHKKVTYKDIYIQWKGPIAIKGGHIKFAAPMEGSSSARFTPFMERNGFTMAFGFGRQFGVSVTKMFGNGMIMAGVAKGGFINHGSASTGFKVAARVIQAIPIENGYVHLGSSFSYKTQGAKKSTFKYSTTALQHLSPKFINTSNIAKKDTFFGLEAGVFKGSFQLMGELGFLNAQLAAPLPNQSDPNFWGGHITLGYFLTGEQAAYNSKSGTYDRPKVKNSILDGGSGAFQVVARFDYLDLVDSGILGGIQKTYAVGINWWLSGHIKVAVNYSRSNITQGFLVAANGADGANTVNAVGFRTQIDW